MITGLSEADLGSIAEVISRFDEVDRAVLFGSRAKGCHKLGSDVDIALYGNRADWQVVSRIHARLEDESPMPYRFDIVDGTHLEHPELKAHIDRVGQVIYTKKRDR
jgi:predicted nucleotidyltransferase